MPTSAGPCERSSRKRPRGTRRRVGPRSAISSWTQIRQKKDDGGLLDAHLAPLAHELNPKSCRHMESKVPAFWPKGWEGLLPVVGAAIIDGVGRRYSPCTADGSWSCPLRRASRSRCGMRSTEDPCGREGRHHYGGRSRRGGTLDEPIEQASPARGLCHGDGDVADARPPLRVWFERHPCRGVHLQSRRGVWVLEHHAHTKDTKHTRTDAHNLGPSSILSKHLIEHSHLLCNTMGTLSNLALEMFKMAHSFLGPLTTLNCILRSARDTRCRVRGLKKTSNDI